MGPRKRLSFDDRNADTWLVVVRVRMRWLVTFLCAGLGVGALAAYHAHAPGLALAALAVVPIVVVQRMRLKADDAGVTVVNLVAHHIPWSEISDFRRGWLASRPCLVVCKNDGTRVHAWVVTTLCTGAYSEAMVFETLWGLRRGLVAVSGEAGQRPTGPLPTSETSGDRDAARFVEAS